MAGLANDMAGLEVTAKKPPIANFPLPQELRDNIYGYLLSSTAVAHGTSYHLNTQLFRVNSTIKADAEKYLYNRHAFVLVSYKWPFIEPALVDIIPKLSTNKNHIQKMAHYSMHIHLTRGHSKTAKTLGIDGAPQLHWFLMFAEDLDVLAAAFSLMLQFMVGPAVLVGTSGNLTPRQSSNITAKTSVTFKLVSTKFRAVNTVFQRKLFDSMQFLLIGEGLKVTVIGDTVNSAEVDRLKHIMSSGVVFSDAKLWSAGRAIRKLKWAASADASHGNHEQLLGLFLTLTGMMIEPEQLIWPGVDPSAPVRISWLAIIYDCMVAAGCLAVRTSNMDDLELIVNMVDRHVTLHHGISPALCGPTVLGALYLSALGAIHLDANPSMTNKDLIDTLLSGNSQEAVGPYLSHDISILRKRDPQALVTPESFPLEQCALHVLPLDIGAFDSYRSYGNAIGSLDFTPPGRTMLGWQNATALEQLSKAEKEAINEMQKKHGIAITHFDQLPDLKRIHDECVATADKQHGREFFSSRWSGGKVKRVEIE